MSSFKDQDYLDLIQKLVDRQYSDSISDYDISNMEWISSEPEEKPKPVNNTLFDLTNIKSNRIKEELFKYTNLKVGAFKIRIKNFSATPSQQGSIISLNLSIWEEKSKTPNGHPCRMDFPVSFCKDSRFSNRPWLKYFIKTGNHAYNVPIDSTVEIIRWLQAINKLIAFI